MAYLQILKGTKPGRVELVGPAVVVGRSPECGVVLDTGAVSRHHALIRCEGDEHRIQDGSKEGPSRNGTYVNGNRINEPTLLKENDRIKICDYLFTFHADQEPPKEKSKFQLVVTDGKVESATIMSTIDASSSTHLAALVPTVRPEVKLRAVLEITRNLGISLQLEELLPKILDSLFKIFPQADRGYILLKDEATGVLKPKAIKNRRNEEDDSLKLSRTIIKNVMEQGQALLLADASSETQFNMSQSIADFKIRSIMCVPLSAQDGRRLGIVQVHTEDRRQQFTQEDLDVLVSVTNTASVAIENAKLHEDLLVQEQLKRELQFAKEVQRGFLPSEWPEVAGYGFFAYYEAAYSVGGDYYGFIELPDGKLALSLGDVSGKGMPAALLMARLSSDIRFSTISCPNAAKAVGEVNRSLRESGLEKFVTLLLMTLDPKTHTVTIVNAGHMAPMIRDRDGNITEIGEEQAGLPLNVSPDPDYEYQQISFTLEPGSAVLIYTDGVSEAMNPAEDLFGCDRLRDALARAPADPVKTGEAVIAAVREFAAGRHQSDDITLICFGRRE